MTEEGLEEISPQGAAKITNGRARYDQARTLRFASNDTILSHLQKMGFISKVASNDESREDYELTPAGMQFLADYEDINFQAISLLSGLKRKTNIQQSPMNRVSILIPAVNEAENIEILLNQLAAALPDIVETTVIDGGSSDATVRVATALGATVILQKGAGKGDALRQAFGGDHGGDIIVVMDADGSNRPEEVPQIIAAIVNGADIAKGSRFMKGGGSTDLSYIRKVGNKLFTSIVNHAWSGEYTDLCYGFMAFRRGALNRLNCRNWTSNCLDVSCEGCYKLLPFLRSANFQIETEICIKAMKLGMKVVEIPSIELKRRYGASKLRGFHDSLSIARVILRELFSENL